MIDFFISARSPFDVLKEGVGNKHLHERFLQVDSRYKKILEKAIHSAEGKDSLIFFKYGGTLSIRGELANELAYLFPNKFVVVVYSKTESKSNISMRGKKCRSFFLEAINGIEGAIGGGHENAVGGQMPSSQVEKFRQNLERIVPKK